MSESLSLSEQLAIIRTRLSFERTELAEERNRLALERNQLAWYRTGAAIIAVSVAFLSIVDKEKVRGAPLIGYFGIIIGIGVLIYAWLYPI